MTVGYEVTDGIAYLSFNRPEKHNALRDEDVLGLISALERLDQDDDAQIGVLFGQGRSFSSGGDVKDRLQRSMEEGSTGGRAHEREAFLNTVNWKPVIAATHGYCLGHALGTALFCDAIVAARNTLFQVVEIKIGLPMASFVPRLGKAAFANEVCLTGRMFTAAEGLDAGFVTRLVEDGEHVREATALARLILENPQPAVREHVRVRRLVAARDVSRFGDPSAAFVDNWTSNTAAQAAVAARTAGLAAKS
ncbi:enoyl-CoA hydratase/isomerase family protein [Candidatus Frankia nodulisporulans]|uniref:enoyl-CoA hydratase/isomerase family protein n=1 Tax=Candidatus Frankia nodulisporulans TaxID=2060052 RepID=UPI0013D744F8|nr:enoyl-CoA hydratase/isomerase family protein [Candidatus Frankia nodulisporulans]